MRQPKKFKVGDYVETDWECTGIMAGEQGLVIDDEYQGSLEVIFPASNTCFTETSWCVAAKHLTILYRPRR